MRKIFIKKMKKNGNSILICAAVFAISIGTMTGCSMTKENAEAVSDQSDQPDQSDQSESENILPVEESTADNAILENTPVPETSEEKVEKTEKVAEAAEVEKEEKAEVAEKAEAAEKTEEVEKTEKTEKEYTEDKMVLKIMREGEMEEIPATLFAGDGYVIYLTDGDWQQHATDAWTAAFE